MQVRIAVVSDNKCKPKKCKLECKKNCPVNRQGKVCIDVKRMSKIAFISEILCIGCNICVKKCPFEAIKILNLPKNLESETTHRFGPNSFKLHRLPIPRQNQVLGLVGTNGIGKSTALKILTGKVKPNLGNYNEPPAWEDIRRYFRGSELQNYFQRILEEDLETVMKPQYVDHIPKKVKQGATVKKMLKKKDDRGIYKTLLETLDLKNVTKREIAHLSGGELQRFAMAVCCCRDVDVYMFDEPSSYLDVKQRMKASAAIRELVSNEEDQRRMKAHGRPKAAYVIVVEHDLAVLDYMSDFVCMLYGTPGAFGIVTMPFSVREGINIFLSGFLPTENMRFRDFELNFKVADAQEDPDEKAARKESEKKPKLAPKRERKKPKDEEKKADDDEDKPGANWHVQDELYWKQSRGSYRYPNMEKTLGSFHLSVECGWFRDSQIVVMLGENGTGKTTFVKMLAGILKPDDESEGVPELKVSYKPQKISPSFQHSVQTLLHKRIRAMYTHPQFVTDVVKPMAADKLYDKRVIDLSGGELQRVALVMALGSAADVYLIDEPSAYLDSEQRIIAAKVIKRYILHIKKSCFVVEHDFIMATYLADKVIVFEGQPAVKCYARRPQSLLHGMNKFLKQLNITFRRDPNNWRPRINKLDSQKDSEQKKSGNYFFLDAAD